MNPSKTVQATSRTRSNIDIRLFCFKIDGKPCSLERANFVKKTTGVYNPSSKEMNIFKGKVTDIFKKEGWTKNDSADTYLESEVNLDIEVTFCFDRPAYHFRGDPSHKILKHEFES